LEHSSFHQASGNETQNHSHGVSPSMKSPADVLAEMRRVTAAVMHIAAPYGFSESYVYPPSEYSMFEWTYKAETDEFILQILRDRGGHIGICLGSKVRRKPRAQMRGPWSLSHLRGYLDGGADHYRFTDVEEQIDWLRQNTRSLLETPFLNSDELNKWAVKASRRLFRRDKK
jgi:hypothetical protein